MDGQKLGVLKTSGVLPQRVPIYEKKLYMYIYAHSIFRYELAFITKMIKTVNMLPFGTKCIILKNNKKNYDFSFKLSTSHDRIARG
jgi:hypothetical protein